MSIIWHMPISLEKINERGKGTIVETLGIEFTACGDNYLQAKMPVDHRTIQPLGIMHGGSSCVLAETIGSIGASLVVNPGTHFIVGLSIYTNHIKTIREGWVEGTGTPLHIGRSTQIWNISIKNAENQLISETRLTIAVLDKKT